MSTATPKLRKSRLNQLFIDGLGEAVLKTGNLEDAPLLLDLKEPYPLKLRVYLYNCTNPPGGRAPDEYKIQVILPGQQRGKRASLDYSSGRMPLLAAYVCFGDVLEDGVFVLWDAMKHEDFSYSANVQVKSETIINALCTSVASSMRGNNEMVLAARPQHLLEAIKLRMKIMRLNIKEASDEAK